MSALMQSFLQVLLVRCKASDSALMAAMQAFTLDEGFNP